MTFNPSEHLSKIKTKQGMKDYLQVQWRLVWFRELCPQGTIETEMVHLDTEKKLAVFKAVVADGKGGNACGHGSESEKDFFDYIEKAETKAVGRGLAMLGYGTQFTGDELDEDHRIVDTPVTQAKPALQTVPAQPHAQDDGTRERLTQVKQLFATIFKTEKWEPFKVHTLGLPVADEGLSIDELDRLYAALLDKKTARAS